jgi:integrase
VPEVGLSATEHGVEAPTTVSTLLDDWLAQGERLGRSPNTLYGYRRKIESTIRPGLGHLRLDEVTPARIDAWYGLLHAEGVSDATILHHHRILSAALHQAVKWGLLAVSPAERATPPPQRRTELHVPPPERVRTLIDLAAASRAPEMASFITFAALTGMRRGELCGLQWGDVDFHEGAVTVRRAIWQVAGGRGSKPPKTHQVRRLVLGDVATATLELRRREAMAAAAASGTELADQAYVFGVDPTGSVPPSPHTVSHAFARLVRRAERPALAALRQRLPGARRADLPVAERWPYRLHDLRHYTATELFRAGVNPRTVAQRLGHADPAITLRVYVADTDDQARAAAGILESGLAPAGSPDDDGPGGPHG